MPMACNVLKASRTGTRLTPSLRARSVSDPIMSPGLSSPRNRAARTCSTMRLDADIGRTSVQRDQFSEEMGLALAPKVFVPLPPVKSRRLFEARSLTFDSCIIVIQFGRNRDASQ